MAKPTVPIQDPKSMPSVLKTEKNAGLIMATNNSSIVSKRSVERLYYPKPHFFQHFVRKPQRRSPAINRGYWLRMHAIDGVVKDFLQRRSEKQKVVINLGCGYDPLPFQWLSREPDLCQNVRFVDVDYKELMMTKSTIVRETAVLEELVKPREAFRRDFVIESDHYYGIGCDLRDLRLLDCAVRSLGGLDEALILCVAEVSVTYMDPNAADALISWAKTMSKDVTFGLLEQFLPDGPDHPFAKTMLGHFDKLHTPLRSIHKHPSLYSQTRRFHDAGWDTIQVTNLWQLWSDPNFLVLSQRLWLDQVEPFDEWEEFALFAAHYFLLIARTKMHLGKYLSVAEGKNQPETSTKMYSISDPAKIAYRLKYFESPKSQGLRRHGAILQIHDEHENVHLAMAYHGGVTYDGRASTSDIYSSTHAEINTSRVPPLRITARLCHTITKLANGYSVLVGGRTSPTTAKKDCYLQTGSGWEPIQDLPMPRFRHSAAAVLLPNSAPGLLVVGGKDTFDHIQDDMIMWNEVSGWESLQVLGHRPPSRFGATLVALGKDFGLWSGGLRSDGVVLQDLWRWTLRFKDDGQTGLLFTPVHFEFNTNAEHHFGRFGASHSIAKNQLLLMGGIAISGCISTDYEIIALDVTDLCCADKEKESRVRVSRIDLQREPHIPRPMLVGHDALYFADTGTLIVGGGAVCFSFGTYWNSGLYMLDEPNGSARLDWSLKDIDTSFAINETSSSVVNGLQGEMAASSPVTRIALNSRQEFVNIVKQSLPKILKGVDFGPCRTLWTKEYLLSKIGADKSVVIHEAHGRSMNFQQKDFTYKTKPFGVFLDEIYKGGHQYLRSISSSDPSKRAANLDLDYPEISGDFRLPAELRTVTETYHSSPLRITGDVAMWLHVDTMANVLCQIEGSKRMILFPPADMVELAFPPGSTTSSLEIFKDGNPNDVLSVPNTHPIEAVLQAGDVLFIPPLWAHTAAPLLGVSVAVNVFFRNLSKGYAAGKDVYGNRDLEAYENGRRDLTKIARAFEDISPDLAHAYLLRLADELRSKALRYAPTQ